MAISTSGIGSGIDIRGLVDDLLKAEGQAKSKAFDTNETKSLSKITGLGSLKSALFDFQTSLSGLKSLSSFQKRLATSADTDVFKAVSDSGAASGVYSIEVLQLATNHKLTSQDFATNDSVVGTGTLKFNFGAVEHSITISAEDQTLSGIRNRINETSSDTGVSANIVVVDSGARLVLSSTKLGSDSIFSVSVNSDSDTNDTDNAGLSQLASAFLATTTTAVDSIVKIDGATVTRSSNSIENAIESVTIDLIDTNIGAAKALTISLDKTSATSSVNSFIKGYNDVMDSINELTKVVGFGKDQQSGVLVGDALLRGIQTTIRKELNSSVNVVTGFKTLAEVGVTSNSKTGKLELSTTKLNSALSSNFDGVGSLFAKEDDGIALRLDEAIKKLIKSDGLINNRITGLNGDIERITESRVQLERNLQQLESRLLKQFISMDALVAQFNSTSSFLNQQLQNMPEPLSCRR